MANYQVWFRLNNGEWNGNPSANPSTNTGGVDLSAMAGTPMYPTVQGTGDAGISVNLGATAFAFPVPSGFVAGWPSSLGGFTTLSPGALYGSASIGGGNLTAAFPGSPGMVQAAQGQTAGAYYFELVNPVGDIFSQDWGGGIGANFAAGGNYSFWFSGAFSSTSINGGALIGGGSIVSNSDLFSRGSELISGIFDFAINVGNVVGVAVFLTDAPPPPPPPTPPAIVPASLGRWRGQCGINWNGLALVGDAFTNVVGLSDFSMFKEYGNGMRMLATAPPLHEDRKRIFVTRFEIEVEAGLGLPDAPTEAPQMVFDYSKNGGITWVPLQVFRSMGAAGDYIRRLRWINLGQARTWIFRIQYSDAARPAIIGTYLDMYKALG